MLRNAYFIFVLAGVLAALSATASAAAPLADVSNTPRLHTHSATHHTLRHTAVRSSSPSHGGLRHSGVPVRARAGGYAHSPSRSLVATSSHYRRGLTARRVSFRSRRVIFTPTPLKGSIESLTRQNEMADAEGLERILDEDDLADRIAQKLLVPLPASSSLAVNPELPENHRYCRPWTADFLADLSGAHASRFGRPVFVSSAVRTVEYQKRLMHVNGNAAAAEGDVVSPHLTGATVDIAKSGMNRQELAWMRSWLLPLQLAGQIDVEEEFRQACFHITVYKNYSAPVPGTQPGSPVLAPDAQIASHAR